MLSPCRTWLKRCSPLRDAVQGAGHGLQTPIVAVVSRRMVISYVHCRSAGRG